MDISMSGNDAFKIPKRVALAETIADAIAGGIANGILKPGERITETALADRMEVSRAPVREALKILHAQGIVTADSNRGFRITTFEQETVEKVLEVRLSLEVILLRDAILNWRLTDQKASCLNAPIAQMHEAAVNNDRAASLDADLSFHRAIAEAADNEIVFILWTAIARHVMIIFSLRTYRDDDLHAVVRHHELFRDFILEQIASKTAPDALKDKLEDHLLQVARTRRTAG